VRAPDGAEQRTPAHARRTLARRRMRARSSAHRNRADWQFGNKQTNKAKAGTRTNKQIKQASERFSDAHLTSLLAQY
jgi:hypothetical protein